MYTVMFMVRRRSDLSLDAFLDYYRDHHGPLMAKLAENRGLISYEHFPVARLAGSEHHDAAPYDAVSIYSFETREQAEACWALPEVVADGEAFIDMTAMVALPVTHRIVFPESEEVRKIPTSASR